MRKLGVAFGLLLNFNAFAEYGVNMTEGVTSVSRDIYGLHTHLSFGCVFQINQYF
jgi:hypothetical protein